jgi:hypothetical protein
MRLAIMDLIAEKRRVVARFRETAALRRAVPRHAGRRVDGRDNTISVLEWFEFDGDGGVVALGRARFGDDHPAGERRLMLRG